MVYNSIGQDISRTFLVPEEPNYSTGRVSSRGRSPYTRARGRTTKAPDAPEFPEIGEGLYNLEGVTEEYFQKYNDLRSYAQSMWRDYGIDVTSPNYDSPEAMRASLTFQKAIADLQYTADNLKNEQELFKQTQGKVDSAYLEGEGYYRQGFDPSQSRPSDRTVADQFQTTVTPEVSEFNDNIGGGKYDVYGGSFQGAMKEYNRLLNYHKFLEQQATQQGNTAEAERQRRIQNGILKPMPEDDDPTGARASRRDRASNATTMLNTISAILSGKSVKMLEASPGVRRAFINADGNIQLETDEGTRIINRTTGDYDSNASIILEYLNKTKSQSREILSLDDLRNLNPDRYREVSQTTWVDNSNYNPMVEAKSDIVTRFSEPSNIPRKKLEDGFLDPYADYEPKDDNDARRWNEFAPLRTLIASIDQGGFMLPVGGSDVPIVGMKYNERDQKYIIRLQQQSTVTESQLEANGYTVEDFNEEPIIKVDPRNKDFINKILNYNPEKMAELPNNIIVRPNTERVDGAPMAPGLDTQDTVNTNNKNAPYTWD